MVLRGQLPGCVSMGVTMAEKRRRKRPRRRTARRIYKSSKRSPSAAGRSTGPSNRRGQSSSGPDSTQDGNSSNSTTQPIPHRNERKRPIALIISIASAIAAMLGFFTDTLGVRSWLLGRQTPNVQIQFFTRDGNQFLLQPSGPTIIPSTEDVEKRRVVFPLNLAVRNLDRETLQGPGLN